MGSKKKDLQLVFSLQYMNNGTSGDKSNMVGMFDIPATTLNWDVFKSYLLAHSGTLEDDLRVSYLDGDNREIPIENQADFAIALYLFRQRARLGEVITIKLDRNTNTNFLTSSSTTKMNRGKRVCISSSDVQTQADSMDSGNNSKLPPDWFLKYMKQFKAEVVEEVTSAVVKAVSKSNSSSSSCHHNRKCKSEFTLKRNRKIQSLVWENNTNSEKDSVGGNKKASSSSSTFNKLERKLDHKLEKLEHKAFKIKLKKVALARSSDSDVGRTSSTSYKSRAIGLPVSNEILMDATTTSDNDTTIPHMSGGESYMQQWEVVNTGKLPWTDETELRYAWGSQALSPTNKRVKCPHLQPGEKGVISVVLDIPETPGNYECYWHFHHNGRRFGHWLGCYVIVDEPIRASALKPCTYYGIDFYNPTQEEQAAMREQQREARESPYLTSSTPKKPKMSHNSQEDEEEDSENLTNFKTKPNESCIQLVSSPKKIRIDSSSNINQTVEDVLVQNTERNEQVNKCIEEVSTTLNNLVLESNKMGIYSDSDNQSIASIADSNYSLISSSEGTGANEYVLINFEQGQEGESENENQRGGQNYYNQEDKENKLKNKGDEQENNTNTNTISLSDDIEIIDFNSSSSASLSSPPLTGNSTNTTTTPREEARKEGKTAVALAASAATTKSQNWGLEFKQDNLFPDLICQNDGNKKEGNNRNNFDAKKSESIPDLLNADERDKETAFNFGGGDVAGAAATACSPSSCAVPLEGQVQTNVGFAYIHYEGQKIPMPRSFLSESFLATAEEAPNPHQIIETENENDNDKAEPSESSVKVSPSEYVPSECGYTVESSHCSAVASSFSEMNESVNANSSPSSLHNNNNSKKRLFVFPQSRPGFEIVYPEYNHQLNVDNQGMNQIDDPLGVGGGGGGVNTGGGNICKSPSENSSWSVCSNAGNEGSFYTCNGINMNMSHVETCLGLGHGHGLPPVCQACQFRANTRQQNSPSCLLRSNNSHCMHCFEREASWMSPSSCHVSQCGSSLMCSETASCNSQQQQLNKQPDNGGNGGAAKTEQTNSVHILPETVVSGAAILATSALNTARNVFNMIVPNKNQETGRWINGHWVSTNPESPREVALRKLAEMGFNDRDLNATLLARYNDNVERVISELI